MKKTTLFIALLSLASSLFVHSSPNEITLSGPGAVVSYPLMVMAEQQSLKSDNIALRFVRWKNPDQLRAMIIAGQVDVSAIPSNLAAIMYNKGHPLMLLNISVWDIMSVVSRDRSLTELADLAGQEIVVPFKNDMPTVVLNKLLGKQLGSRTALVKQRSAHNLLDSSQLLLAGQVKHALLIEPVTSMVLYRNHKQKGQPLYRAINISEHWKREFPEAPELPQAGIIGNHTVAGNTSLMHKINRQYQQQATWCKTHAKKCAGLVSHYLPGAPKAALVEAIKHTRLEARPAQQAKQALEGFYQVLARDNAKLIGGKLPDGDFYLGSAVKQ